MTLNEASKITQIWGRYLEYMGGKLLIVFGARIPESFLPFPIDILEEALNIMIEYHHKRGNKRVVEGLKVTFGALTMYVDDEEAILEAAKHFNEPRWRERFIPTLKKCQIDWIRTQEKLEIT
jgi:hypothetical protein